jgi:hypothetical protein
VKAQILEKLIKGPSGFDSFIRLVFTRVIKIVTVCLILTLIVWLVWLGKFTFGSFLGGAALSFFVFLILRFLKHQLGESQVKQDSVGGEELGKLTDPDEIKPKAPVKD